MSTTERGTPPRAGEIGAPVREIEAPEPVPVETPAPTPAPADPVPA